MLGAGAAIRIAAQRGTDDGTFDAETLRHFQALVRLDTSSPPGNEIRAVEYLKGVLDQEGIPYQVFAKDPQRPNLVARIKGNGRRRPVLVLGHTDVVTVDPSKWTFPPFGAQRDSGYVYGRDFLHFCFPLAEHDERAWGRRLHLPLQFFTGKVATAARGRLV